MCYLNMTIFTLVKFLLLFLLGYGPLLIASCYEPLLRRCSTIGNAYFIVFYMRLISQIYCLLFFTYFSRHGVSSYINFLIQHQNTIDYTKHQPTLTLKLPPQNKHVIQTENTNEAQQSPHEESKSDVSFFYFY